MKGVGVFNHACPADNMPTRYLRSFQVDQLTPESVILVDDEWQALSLPVESFSCRLEQGRWLVAPFDSDGTPVWWSAVMDSADRVD